MMVLSLAVILAVLRSNSLLISIESDNWKLLIYWKYHWSVEICLRMLLSVIEKGLLTILTRKQHRIYIILRMTR